PEELHDAQVDRRMEPQPALVGAERAVELHPEPAVDVHLAAVVLPRHPEDDLPFGFADPLQDLHLGVLRMPGQHRDDAVEHLPDCLMELEFTWVAPHHGLEDRLEHLPCRHRSSLQAASCRPWLRGVSAFCRDTWRATRDLTGPSLNGEAG